MFTLYRTFIDSADDPVVGLEVFITEHLSNNPIRYSLGGTTNLLTSKYPLKTDANGVINCVVHDDDGCRISVYAQGAVVFREEYVASNLVQSTDVKILEALPGSELPITTLAEIILLPKTIYAREDIPFDAGVVLIYSNGTYEINPNGVVFDETGDVVQDGTSLKWSSTTPGTEVGTLVARFAGLSSNTVNVNVT